MRGNDEVFQTPKRSLARKKWWQLQWHQLKTWERAQSNSNTFVLGLFGHFRRKMNNRESFLSFTRRLFVSIYWRSFIQGYMLRSALVIHGRKCLASFLALVVRTWQEGNQPRLGACMSVVGSAVVVDSPSGVGVSSTNSWFSSVRCLFFKANASMSSST